MTKILIVSNDAVPDGYGRICSEIAKRLYKRGFEILSASIAYDGLLPAQYEGEKLPYHVASLQNKDRVGATVGLMNAWQPDIVMVIQDFPYLQELRLAPLDWSKFAFIGITPIDGAPIHPAWIETAKQADGMLTISQFGVQSFRQQGVAVDWCPVAANADVFYPLPTDQRAVIRAKLGIAPDAFVVGTMAQNQGRKDIPAGIEGFIAFAQDKPTARLLLDMDAVSPVGWDIRALFHQFGWDISKVLFREDCIRAGVINLRERYNILDAHMVISHREGFGFPLLEAQACGVVSMAMDYCSGGEICGENHGVLIKPIAGYHTVSTWGNALDLHPDLADISTKLQWLYDNPLERAAIAQRGMAFARARSWDKAADSVHIVINRVLQARQMRQPVNNTVIAAPIVHTGVQQTFSPDGLVLPVETNVYGEPNNDTPPNSMVKTVELIEKVV